MEINLKLEDDIVDMYINQKMSGNKIANELGIHRYYVYKVIKNKNIARNNSEKSKKYFCNSNYFDVIRLIGWDLLLQMVI